MFDYQLYILFCAMQKQRIFFRHLSTPVNLLNTKYLHYKFTKGCCTRVGDGLHIFWGVKTDDILLKDVIRAYLLDVAPVGCCTRSMWYPFEGLHPSAILCRPFWVKS
jgi:hypothetical protein